MLSFPATPSFHDHKRWSITPGIPLGRWTCEQWQIFRDALRGNRIYDAWSCWRSFAGAGSSEFVSSPIDGAWSCGGRARELSHLFKQRRRQLFHEDFCGAAHTLDLISTLINDSAEGRLHSWREKVRTRDGAASWVKRRLALLSDVALPALHTANSCANTVARALAPEFAERWNAGIYKLPTQKRLAVSPLLREGLPCTLSVPEPPPCDRDPYDLAYLRSLPEVAKPSLWTPELVCMFIPSGAPVLDGMDVLFLNELSYDALSALSDLLKAADAGAIPAEWRYAQVTLIPKPGEAVDRRPLTIISCIYRLWARRHAARLQEWLVSVKPFGLSGVVAGVGCQDVLWDVQSRIHDSVSRRAPAAFVISMDLSKCFDHMLHDPLREICEAIGFSHGVIALQLYAVLKWALFVDGSPSDVLLRGSSLRGIPQGCPISCCLCNLYALAWHHAMKQACASATTYTVLDDRLAFCRSWAEVAAVVFASLRLDRAFGPTLSLNKIVRGVASDHALPHPPAATPAERRQGLGSIACVNCFKYLGVDISLQPSFGLRQTARARLRDLYKRCSAIRVLRRIQRSACTADALSAMWAAGGTVVDQKSLDKSVSAAFDMLIGLVKPSRVLRRSRLLTHLILGPGPQHTCLPVVLMNCWLRQWVRQRLSGRLPTDLWEHLWRSSIMHTIGSVFLGRGLTHGRLLWQIPRMSFPCSALWT